MDNFLKPKLAFLWSLFSSYSIFAASLNLSHLIPHHESCNTFGPSLWPFFVFHGGRCARLMDFSAMAACAHVCDCGAVYLWGRYLASGLILKRCRLTDASWKIIQRWSCRSEEWKNGRFRIPFIKPGTWSCALCVYFTCQRFNYTMCVQDTWPLGNFTSKSWCANKDKRRSLAITSLRFRSAGQFSAFDWAPGWTFSWFLFTVVVLFHLF